DPGHPTLPVDVGMCSRTDPATGLAPVDSNGDTIDVNRITSKVIGHVQVSACPVVTSAYNSCDIDTTRCVPVSVPCAAPCEPGCHVAAMQDAGYQTQLALDLAASGAKMSDGTTQVAARKTFGTRVKVVGAQSTLARALALLSAPFPLAPRSSAGNVF